MHTILNVSQNHFIRGGSDRYFFTLAEMLEKHGHRVVPFTAASPKNEPSEWEHYFPPRGGLRAARDKRPVPIFIFTGCCQIDATFAK